MAIENQVRLDGAVPIITGATTDIVRSNPLAFAQASAAVVVTALKKDMG
jgi:hypothetical protein